MKRWLLSVALLLAGVACIAHAQVPMTGAGKGAPGGCSATLSLDGSSVISSFAVNPSVSTAAYSANDVVVAVAFLNSNSVTGLSISGGTGLTWTAAPGENTGTQAPTDQYYVWWAAAASTQSAQTITETSSGTSSYLLIVPIKGANTSTPFDGNTAHVSTLPVSIVTSFANDFLIAASANSSGGTDSLWTALANQSFVTNEYRIVSSTGTYNASVGSSGAVNTVGMAIKRSC